MSLLGRLRPPSASVTAGDGPPAAPVPPLTAALTGLATAGVSWLAIALPTVLAWATSAQTSASWGQAVRVGTAVWLAMHRVGLDVPGGRISLLPLAGAAVPVVLCWRAGRRIGAGWTRRAVQTRGSPVHAVAPSVAALSGGYAGWTLVAALASSGDGVRPVLWQAVLSGLLLPAVSAGPAAWAAAAAATGRPVGPQLADAVRLPLALRRAARPGLTAAALLVACGALLLTVTMVVHFSRIGALQHALAPGVVGGGVLLLGQLAVLPNLALWAVAFVAGPGFAVGTDTLVGAGGSDLGLLPLVPVLGAVPAPGALPVGWWAVVLVPLAVGLWVGWWVAGEVAADLTAGPWHAVRDALLAAAVATVLLTVLVVLSGGSAGPGTLADVGPSGWRVAVALAAEIGAGAAVGGWLTHRSKVG